MNPAMQKKTRMIRRKKRVRKKIQGTAETPRLNVFRSNNHIYAQVIDDDSGQTLVAASTLSPEIAAEVKSGNVDAAKKVGLLLAKKAQEKDISAVRFDRNGYLYHGRVRALADAAREGGLKF